jgi:hypothetical protein
LAKKDERTKKIFVQHERKNKKIGEKNENKQKGFHPY